MKTRTTTFLFVAVAELICTANAFSQKGNATILSLRSNQTPSYVNFDNGKRGAPKLTDSKQVLTDLLPLKTDDELVKRTSEIDQIGYTHQSYQQYYKGVKVEHGSYTIHADQNGNIASANGEFYVLNDIEITPKITEADALKKALKHIGATTYLWENKLEEAAIKIETRDANATYYPKGELVIVDDYNQEGDNLALAYKFDISADKPVTRDYIYVNAYSGKILLVDPIIKHCIAYSASVIKRENKQLFKKKIKAASPQAPAADAAASGDSRYSGSLRFIAGTSGSQFILYETARGGGIHTYNNNNKTGTASATEFTDNDNNWTVAEHPKDDVAIDAHWGAEMVYDYWKKEHNRNSYNGSGGILKSYVHEDSQLDNAFWNGAMHYGDGATLFNSLTAIDVCAHEIGHGICGATVGLVYSGESGAMNEGFSDIWGATIEHYSAPNDPKKKMWYMGEEIVKSTSGKIALRFMDDPKKAGHPGTYKGVNWYTGTNSNTLVHTNSGVLNHWYYLLTEGEKGTAEAGGAYDITGVGINKSQFIAFAMESKNYMNANSTYADARNAGITAATALYGACSAEVKAVTDAWFAVGIGAKYTGNALASPTITYSGGILTCNSAVTGLTYQWYLNGTLIAGATATTYTVTQNGKYSVTIKDGNQCSGTSATFNVSNVGVTDLNLTQASIKIYPNPAAGVVNFAINSNTENKATIVLFDVTGRVISSSTQTISKGLNTVSRDLTGIAPGTYVVKIITAETILTGKLNIGL